MLGNLPKHVGSLPGFLGRLPNKLPKVLPLPSPASASPGLGNAFGLEGLLNI